MDALVIIASLSFGPIVGGLAGGVGSALADAIGGWFNWVPFTLVIKGVEGVVAGYIAGNREDRDTKRFLLAWVVGGLVMVTGYFLVQVYLYGIGGTLVELPFNFVQMVVAGMIGVPVSFALQRQLRL
jgi:uncharacterized membrane protein